MSRFFRHMAFLSAAYPVSGPLGLPRGGQPYSLTPERYARFLISTFDFWFRSGQRGASSIIATLTISWASAWAGSRRPAVCWASAASNMRWKRTAVCIPAIFICWTATAWAISGQHRGGAGQAREALGFVEQSRAIAPGVPEVPVVPAVPGRLPPRQAGNRSGRAAGKRLLPCLPDLFRPRRAAA